MDRVAVIGGGPAGLRVAQLLAQNGVPVQLYEQKRSVGRKFLIAGKSGLNLTNDAATEDFLSVYQGGDLPQELWAQIYDGFTSADLRAWAGALGQETFVSSGKKVFPREMKAAPLLRALVQEIKHLGGGFSVNHTFLGMEPVSGGGEEGEGYRLTFMTPSGEYRETFKKVVFSVGGGSWAQTGSDGKWAEIFTKLGVSVNALCAANAGWEVAWEEWFMKEYEGSPLKNVVCTAGEKSLKGEVMITRYGMEGGPIYRLGHALRHLESPQMRIDFKPDFTVRELEKKAESVRRNLTEDLPRRWKISAVVVGLLRRRHPEIFQREKVRLEEIQLLASSLKSYPINFTQARPINEAISTAGGVAWSEVDENLMLRNFPGVYLCGEMLDWEAPTGGYLLQGCFSSASWVGHALLR